ncbi:hypothetical protein [Streptomyces sp. NPDC001139]
MRETGEIPDPRDAQMSPLKRENTKLPERLAQSEQTSTSSPIFRNQALAHFADQHEEVVRLREVAVGKAKVSRLPGPRTTVIGSCS